MFPVYPYLIWRGTRRSGKTTSAKFVEKLAFNSTEKATTPSEATIYRLIDKSRASLIIAEAGWLGDAEGTYRSIMEVGYEKGGTVYRCVGDENEPRGFDMYAPKAFVSRRSLPFEDKGIPVFMERPKKPKLKKYVARRDDLYEDPEFIELRKSLLLFALRYQDQVREEFESLDSGILPDRDFRLFKTITSHSKGYWQRRLSGYSEIC